MDSVSYMLCVYKCIFVYICITLIKIMKLWIWERVGERMEEVGRERITSGNDVDLIIIYGILRKVK